MTKKTVKVPVDCFFQGCYNEAFERAMRRGKRLCHQYNRLSPNHRRRQERLLKKLLGKMGREVVITPPFWCDYGTHIEIGDSFYANHNLVITDGAPVKFGDHVFVAPNCVFTTAEHALDPDMRKAGIEIAKPITVGNNVWIGAGAIILAGATIGDNTVIAAGSVVKGDIPANVVAAGVPCKVKRMITEQDRFRYPVYSGEYEM